MMGNLRFIPLLACILGSLLAAAPSGTERLRALRTPDECRKVLENRKEDPVLRRAAFRSLLYNQATREDAVRRGLTDSDAGIRALAAFELYSSKGLEAMPQLKAMLTDPSDEVGYVLVEVGRTMPDRTAGLAFLEKLKETTLSLEVKKRIAQAIGFKFYRDNRPFSQNPVHDHQITLVKSIPLPLQGWKFRTDPDNSGHLEKHSFFKDALPESGWATVAVGTSWETQGFKDYDGFAWYRLTFKLPPKVQGEAAELCFGAVDECAWVWLNGKYIGQHDEGPKGWNTPFRLDVTKEIRWGAKNTLVVRVEDSEQAGGIWKPVVLEVLK